MSARPTARGCAPRADKPGTPPGDPDAELIRTCAQHIVNLRAYNSRGGRLEAKDDPLWHIYKKTMDAITAAEPQTIEGMLAKARAAKAEAKVLDGGEMPEGCVAGTWAWDLVNDLLRLYGGSGQRSRRPAPRVAGNAVAAINPRAARPETGGAAMSAVIIPFPRPVTKDELAREMKAIHLAKASGRLSEEEHQAQLFQFFTRLVGAFAAQHRGIAAPSAHRTDRL